MKLFYTGPVVNTEMLVAMLEKLSHIHSIGLRESCERTSSSDWG